ncbi:uncharacterized protein KZ484_026384 isoform 1-T1 [Pholidichthys leucotaenia]
MDRGIFPGVKQSFDMWHEVKNLKGFHLYADKMKGQAGLLLWLCDIVNHFWWCSNKAATHDDFMAHSSSAVQSLQSNVQRNNAPAGTSARRWVLGEEGSQRQCPGRSPEVEKRAETPASLEGYV